MASLELSDDENERFSDGVEKNNRESDDDGKIPSDNEEDDPTIDGRGRRIDPSTSKKKVVRNPQPRLNVERIQGSKGIRTIEKYFEGFQFYGNGREKLDLDRVMKRLEHWAHRLFPKYQFDDFLETMEDLGNKKNVQVFLKKYRYDMDITDQNVVEDEDETETERQEHPALEESPVDEFDKLISEQIEKQKQITNEQHNRTISNNNLPKADGQVLGSAKPSELTEEIKARIEANRQMAIKRRMDRLKRLKEKNNEERTTKESQVDSSTKDSNEILNVNCVNVEIEKESGLNISERKKANSSAKEMQMDDVRETGERNKEKMVKGTPSVANEIESIPDNMKHSRLSEKNVKPNETSVDDSERLLTHEELLMEIDGAIDEIINRSGDSKST